MKESYIFRQTCWHSHDQLELINRKYLNNTEVDESEANSNNHNLEIDNEFEFSNSHLIINESSSNFKVNDCLENYNTYDINEDDKLSEISIAKKIKFIKSKKRTNVISKDENNSKSTICDLCGRTFSTPYILGVHKQCFHENARKYKCELCDYKANLKIYVTVSFLLVIRIS